MTMSSHHHEAYYGRRILVLGGTGFIGRWVARTLSQHGAQVVLVVRHLPTAQRLCERYDIHGTCLVGDLCVPDTIATLVHQVKPAMVFNLAGYGIDRSERQEAMAYQINAALVRALGEAMLVHRDPTWSGQDIVHVGSALEYGNCGGNLAEDTVPCPTTLYGQSKLAGTLALAEICESSALKGLTARLFSIYGPGEHPGRLLPALWETARTGAVLPLTAGTQQRDFTYVDDVVDGLLRLGVAAAPAGIMVNIATGVLTSVRDFVESAARLWHIPDDRLIFGALPTRAEEMQHTAVAVERLRRLVQWIPSIGLQEGLRRMTHFVTLLGEE